MEYKEKSFSMTFILSFPPIIALVLFHLLYRVGIITSVDSVFKNIVFLSVAGMFLLVSCDPIIEDFYRIRFIILYSLISIVVAYYAFKAAVSGFSLPHTYALVGVYALAFFWRHVLYALSPRVGNLYRYGLTPQSVIVSSVITFLVFTLLYPLVFGEEQLLRGAIIVLSYVLLVGGYVLVENIITGGLVLGYYGGKNFAVEVSFYPVYRKISKFFSALSESEVVEHPAFRVFIVCSVLAAVLMFYPGSPLAADCSDPIDLILSFIGTLIAVYLLFGIAATIIAVKAGDIAEDLIPERLYMANAASSIARCAVYKKTGRLLYLVSKDCIKRLR